MGDILKFRERESGRQEIVLNETRREALEIKLESYKDRYDPEFSAEEQLDTIYKTAILEDLLDKGRTDKQSMMAKMSIKYKIFDSNLFENAYRVIEDYNVTGGAMNIGGSLPREEENDTTEI
jgi:hypothetical protein